MAPFKLTVAQFINFPWYYIVTDTRFIVNDMRLILVDDPFVMLIVWKLIRTDLETDHDWYAFDLYYWLQLILMYEVHTFIKKCKILSPQT